MKSETSSPTPLQIARSLLWLGRIGLILQVLLGFIPLLVVVTYVLSQSGQQQTGGFSLGLWLAIACLIILIFSIYWCFRYTQLAKKLKSSETRPSKSQIIRDLQLGLFANIGIMVFAVLIALLRVGELTFKLLTLPQGATVIAPNQIGTTFPSQGALIAPSNMIAIQAMLNVIAAGLVGVIVALLLLYQVGQHRNTID
ncbi:DUF3611 family protein [Crocosphaera sp. UHCC 0190]|uniref:DUF3611 family protein n=1 Tax=Crocosphaera sp. UHCC 0190 TaxID=3110246 RepID=UPI002B205E72|nr:DUF3611 family protein [Crocosphaera sp. UHCC 0190]MEA5508733.1 DUF3611 family protein [Crocosphaera sp. UHCC 0190]